MKSTENIKIFTTPYCGDLYRIYFDLSGKVYAIKQYPLMQSAERDMEWKHLPHAVQTRFENHFVSQK